MNRCRPFHAEAAPLTSAGIVTVRTVITLLAVVALMEGQTGRTSGYAWSIQEVMLSPRDDDEERIDLNDPKSLASQIARAARVLFQSSSMHVMLGTIAGDATVAPGAALLACVSPREAEVRPLDALALHHVDLPPPSHI